MSRVPILLHRILKTSRNHCVDTRVRVPATLRRRLRRYCAKHGRSMQDVIEQALRQKLARCGGEDVEDGDDVPSGPRAA